MIKLIQRSEKIALIGKQLKLTYDQLLEHIEQYSRILKDSNNQRIVIFSENRSEWIFALFAVWKTKGIVIPIDVLSSSDDVTYILSDCLPARIFCSKEKQGFIQDTAQKAEIKPEILVFEDIKNELLNHPPSDLVIDDHEKTAVVLYTSGTTGNPKGVMLSFENILTNLTAVCSDVKIFTESDKTMILLPLHHILPLVGSVIAPLYSGGTMVYNNSLAAEDMLAVLKQFEVTIMIGVPRLYQLIYKGLKEKIRQSFIAGILVRLAGIINSLKFSRIIFKSVQNKFGGNLKYLVCGGAPVDPDIVRLFKTLGFEILEGYGMTETAPMITFTRPGTVTPGIPGQLLPGLKIRFENDEIVVSGKNVMQGYYNKLIETQEVLKEGWLYTGDLGYLDKKGFLHITGRRKEIIVLPNGKNINPEEIERMLLKKSTYLKDAGVFLHDGILQAVLLPNFKTINEDGITDIEEYIRWNIIDAVNKSVSPYKKVLRFHITTGELPKTRLGKLKRYLLHEFAIKKEVTVKDEPQTSEYLALKRFLEEETQQKINPDDHIELDLAIDSLGRVSLSAFIDTAFGVNIPENNLADFASISKMAEFVHQKKVRSATEGISWSHILKEKVHINLPNSWVTHDIFKHLSQIVFRIFMRVKAKGIENLPDQACIIAPNHQSILDGFLVLSFFKRKFLKKTYVYAKEKHFSNPIMRFLARRNNVILVDVNKDLKLSIQKLAEVLKKGKNLMIFPEGTRTLNGKLGEFKQTFAILSQELKVPVVPVAINGSFDILPSGSVFPRLFKKVSVEFLAPVYPENHSYESLKNLVYRRLESNLAKRKQ